MAMVVPFSALAVSAAPAAAAPTVQKVQAAPRLPSGSAALGAVPASASITGAVVLQSRDNAALQAFIAQVTTRTSPEFHQYLAPGAFASRFGPRPATVAAVKAQLEADGLKVTGTARDNLFLTFTGSAKAVDSAFHTSVDRYRLADGTIGTGTSSSVELPSTIAASVSAVVGLNDLVKAQPAGLRRASKAAAASRPAAVRGNVANVSGAPSACPGATTAAEDFGGLTDDQIANAYGAFGLYGTHDTGAGQHIAVYELEPFLPSDLTTFDSCYFGAAAANQMGSRLSVTPVDGGQPAGPGSAEAILDVEDVSAMAPGANVDVYEAPNTTYGGLDEYSTIVNDDRDQIVTTSWGLCEQALQEGEPGVQQAENLLFEQAAAQGQTVFSSAGDEGSDDCNTFETPQPVSPILSVDDPSSQPYVVSVGGTTIDDAATRPPQEHVWNDGAFWGAGGGGISQSWAMPTWQRQSTVPGLINPTTISAARQVEAADSGNANYAFCQSAAPAGTQVPYCRELPDVSAQGDEFTGAITVYAKEFGGSGWITIGGTSSSTPIWAAMLALINASGASPTCTSPGAGVGFASPLLYAVASNPAAYAASFNDITAGNNDPYGADGLYPAGAGYDMASGLGSPQLTAPNGGAGLAHYLCTLATPASRPSVSAVSPTAVPTATGGSVTITGSGFDPAGTPDVAGVQIGTFQLPSVDFTVNSDTSITATVPVATDLVPPGEPSDGAGGYQVSVALTDGETSLPNPSSLLEYVDQSASNTIPAVTGVRTYAGPEAGGNTVDIFGSGFTGTTSVTFGGVAVASPTIVRDTEITATVPAYSPTDTTCAADGSSFGETATTDICQVQVVVTNANGSSTGPTPLPLYEGSLSANPLGVIPAPAGQEAAPQPDEYDYLPAPQITSISTSAGPASYASENGGTVVTLTGAGFNLAGLDFVAFGDPGQASSQALVISASGTELQVLAPGVQPTTNSSLVPVSVMTVDGLSNTKYADYAGMPVVTSAMAATGKHGGPDYGGTPMLISGSGFSDADAVEFNDMSGVSVGTQYHFTVNNDGSISTTTVSQNPGLVDVQVCTASGCSLTQSGDQFVLFPPGAPDATSAKPASGPATGGTKVTISGQNLGCVTGVTFGTVKATTFANPNPAGISDCGSTSAVTATAPALPKGTHLPDKVKVTVTTEESSITGNAPVTTAVFTYEPVAPKLTADAPPRTGTVSVAYGPYTFRANGDPAPRFTVTSGKLPPGLALNATTGVLSGRPTAAGVSSFRVTASNGASPSAVSATLTITIKA